MPETGEHVRSWKPLTPALRVATTVVMLVWLAGHVDLSKLRLHSSHLSTLLWLVVALALTFLGLVLAAVRWQRVLAAVGISSRVPTLLGHYLTGSFLANFLPSTIGGDLWRISRLAAANGQTPGTAASVLLERLTGWLVLPVLALFALFVNPGLRRIAPVPTRIALGVSLLTLALLVVLLAVAGSSHLGRLVGRREGWRRFTGSLRLGLERARRHPALAFEILTVGFAYQLAVVLAAFVAAKALGVGVGWTAMLAFFPVVAMIQVLPLTVSGLGTREAALVFFLHPLGVARADAFALGLLIYVLNMAVSLLGAPGFAVGRRPARVPA